MSKKTYITHIAVLLFLIIAVYLLFGCTSGSYTPEMRGIDETATIAGPGFLRSATPTPTLQIQPTHTPDLLRPDTVRATYAAEATLKANQLTPTPQPTTTSTSRETLMLPPECEPFPDEILYVTNSVLGPTTIDAICDGDLFEFVSPVQDIHFLDYTPLTGRMAYSLIGGAYDPSNLLNLHDLWIFDFWTTQEQQWLDSQVEGAWWSPVNDSKHNLQPLAVLLQDGTLNLLLEPGLKNPIVNLGNLCGLSWSPNGDKIAYSASNTSPESCSTKDGILYTVSTQGGQPRKLGSGAGWGSPAWALESEAILYPSSPFKVAMLDGSGSFMPSIPDGIEAHDEDARGILWDPTSKMLIFEDPVLSDDQYFWIYELSEDLYRVTNRLWLIERFFHPIYWEVPGQSLRNSYGDIKIIVPEADIFSIEAKVISITGQTMLVYNSGNLCEECEFRTITINEQTTILDLDGKTTGTDVLRNGISIEITGRLLPSNTLTIFATTIQILGE